MKTKNCKECNTEFSIENDSPGLEQLYCSKPCRNKAANTRRVDKIKEEIKHQYEKEENTTNIPTSRGTIYPSLHDRIDTNPSIIGLLEQRYQVQSECNYQKLKIESLEKEINELRADKMDLESELDEMEVATIGKVDEWADLKKSFIPLIPEIIMSFISKEKPKEKTQQKQNA